MNPIRRIFRLPFARPRDVARDVDDEIAFHIAMREERLRATGVPTDDAARLAYDRFGNIASIREECVYESTHVARRTRLSMWIDELRRDITVAFRSLRRAKAFTGAVILTLALGIGANTTMFSVVTAVILHPISGVDYPEALFEAGETIAYPDYRDLVHASPSISLGAISERRIALGIDAEADHTIGALVSGNLFSIVGIRPAIGRVLIPNDDIAGAAPVAVLAYGYWERALGADRSIIGRTVAV